MLKRLNYTKNFVLRSGKRCTILKLQLGGTLKQTLVNAQHSLCVLCIFESTKIDMLFVCMLRSRQLSYEPVPPFLCLFIFHTLMHLYQPTCPVFHLPELLDFPFLSSSLLPCFLPFPSRSFPFLFVLRVLLSFCPTDSPRLFTPLYLF